MVLSRIPRIGSSSWRLPVLPHAIWYGFLVSTFPLFLFERSCPGFVTAHPLFVASQITGAVSTFFWLRIASTVRASADYGRARRIEEFISDPSSPVPAPVPGLETAPLWFQAWNWLNLAIFLLLMALVVRWLLALPPLGTL
jgi:hypothetical protein